MSCVFDRVAPPARMKKSEASGMASKCSISMPRYSDVAGCVLNMSSSIDFSNGESQRSTATGLVPGFLSLAVTLKLGVDQEVESELIENWRAGVPADFSVDNSACKRPMATTVGS